MSVSEDYDYNVFVNCPFDFRYQKLFRAVIFTVIDCGFSPRCALELNDSSVERLDKIFNMIADCRLSIHDISRTQLDSKNRLPRFNMPFELGMFLGAKRFGNRKQKSKNCLILDTEKYRYQKFISDIGGKDIDAHGNDILKAIRVVRNWLAAYSKVIIPGASSIHKKYMDFLSQLPQQCKIVQLVTKKILLL